MIAGLLPLLPVLLVQITKNCSDVLSRQTKVSRMVGMLGCSDLISGILGNGKR